MGPAVCGIVVCELFGELVEWSAEIGARGIEGVGVGRAAGWVRCGGDYGEGACRVSWLIERGTGAGEETVGNSVRKGVVDAYHKSCRAR